MSKTIRANGDRYVQAGNVVATDMDGETVMMDVQQGSYFALSGSGPQIWKQLEEPKNIDEVIEALSEAFETSEVHDLEDEVTGFIAKLLEMDLVKAAS